jgi:hypothetical protein
MAAAGGVGSQVRADVGTTCCPVGARRQPTTGGTGQAGGDGMLIGGLVPVRIRDCHGMPTNSGMQAKL